MTGVPGGDVTLHAAITETLERHLADPCQGIGGAPGFLCACYRRGQRGEQWWFPFVEGHRAHVADRVLAVLADRLPHTPADQLAALIGGTVQIAPVDLVDGEWTHESWAVGPATPWVPDSPPAAPEPRQDT